MSSQLRFSDPAYIAWLRDTLSLLYLKEGIEDITNNLGKKFHDDLILTLGGSACTSCSPTDITRDTRGRRWYMNCPLCDSWLQQIIKNYGSKTLPNLYRDNTNPQLWPTEPWQVLKCYMGYGCQGIHTAKDADAQNILTLYKNCQHFATCGQIGRMDLIGELLKIRNSLFHSGNFLVDDTQLQNDMQTMLTFLAGVTPKSPGDMQAVADATRKIVELQNNSIDLSLTSNRDLELRALQQKQDALDRAVKELRADLGSVETTTNTTKGAVKKLRTDLNAVEGTSNTTKGAVKRLRADLEAVETTANTTDGAVKKLRIDLEAVETTAKTTDGAVKTLKTGLNLLTHKQNNDKTYLDDQLQKVRSDQDHFKRFLHDNNLELTSSIEQHERRIVNLEKHSQQERQQQHPGKELNVEDFRATLVDLYKERLHCIPIYLIKPDWKHPVENLFVKQKLRRVDPRGNPEHSDNPHMQKSGNPGHNKHATCNDKHIDKVTDIFFKDGKLCKDVYITSEAGYGKTSLCAHLVRLWCDAHSKSEADLASADPNLAKDLQSMKKFSLLFYINLRDADIPKDISKSDEISLLVHTQLELSDQDYSIVDVKRCLSNPSTLVLMDSLDEMRSTRLPYRGLHNKSCIVTTSRPWKLEALRSQLHSKIGHQQIEIVGLTETSPKDLVTNVLKILNKECDQEKNGGEFLRDIYNSDLQDFLTIPVLILQMLSLWFDGKSFGRSQSEIYSNVIHHQILTSLKSKELPRYEEISQEKFPFSCCSDLSCPCKAFEELLWKVSRLAFHTLFGENREMCLVFDHKVTSFYKLSGDEVDICLKMGILTQHKLFVKKMSEDKKSVGFLHKTNQEYFAAVYLSYRWEESVKKQIFSVISDLDRAMELDKVLLFCSQLNPEVARELSGLISVRADDDSRVQEYRQSGEYANEFYDYDPNIDLIYKIQNIVSAAVQQNIEIYSPQTNTKDSSTQQPAVASTPSTQDRSRSTPKLILADIIMEEPQWFCTEKYRVNVEALDMAAVKSVNTNVAIWKHLEQARCLQNLVVYNGWKTKVETLHGVVVRNQSTLRTLSLQYFSRLDLSPLGNKLADMLTCDLDLTCLLLDSVELSHEQCEILCGHLSTTQNLRRLTLDNIECQTHRAGWSEEDGEHCWVKTGCCDVKLHSKLELLKLSCLPFKHVSFPADDLKTCEISLHNNVPATTSAISCLTSASNLSNVREFTCGDLHGVASVRELATVLLRLHGLQRIVLCKIDFGCLREIRLSAAAAKTLESVELALFSTITAEGLESLLQSVGAPRVKIGLYDLTIIDSDPIEFLQRLRDSPEVTEDRGVEYEDATEYGWGVDEYVFYKNKRQTS